MIYALWTWWFILSAYVFFSVCVSPWEKICDRIMAPFYPFGGFHWDIWLFLILCLCGWMMCVWGETANELGEQREDECRMDWAQMWMMWSWMRTRAISESSRLRLLLLSQWLRGPNYCEVSFTQSPELHYETIYMKTWVTLWDHIREDVSYIMRLVKVYACKDISVIILKDLGYAKTSTAVKR